MWPNTFAARLAAWAHLRHTCEDLPVDQALDQINRWWFSVPWRPYYLHWDDRSEWPDPWQLLSDNHYCDIARGLGILYTITLLDRADMDAASLVLTNDDCNLVLVGQSKYILNWNPDTILNTNLKTNIKQHYPQELVRKKYF